MVVAKILKTTTSFQSLFKYVFNFYCFRIWISIKHRAHIWNMCHKWDNAKNGLQLDSPRGVEMKSKLALRVFRYSKQFRSHMLRYVAKIARMNFPCKPMLLLAPINVSQNSADNKVILNCWIQCSQSSKICCVNWYLRSHTISHKAAFGGMRD